VSAVEDEASKEPDASKLIVATGAAATTGHANVYPQLVLDDNDLVGLVAYGLYKRRKRAWIDAFHDQHQKYPTPQECDGFSFGYRTDALAALRKEAEGAMATFAEQVVENNIETMKLEALDAKTQSIMSGIDGKLHSLGSYRHHVMGHLLGFVILVGIVAFGTFIVRFEPSIEGAYNWLFRSQSTGHSPAPVQEPKPN